MATCGSCTRRTLEATKEQVQQTSSAASGAEGGVWAESSPSAPDEAEAKESREGEEGAVSASAQVITAANTRTHHEPCTAVSETNVVSIGCCDGMVGTFHLRRACEYTY